MSEPILLKERRGAVLWLVLNDPRRMNVLSDEMLDALETAFAGLREDDETRAVVLAARGKAFCAGHDLKQMQAHRGDADGGRGYFGALFARCSALMQSIGELPQPVIASVQGVAAAALVNRAVPAEALEAETMALAERVASKLPVAMGIGKPAFYAQAGLPLEAAYAVAVEAMVENLMEADTNEGIDAFIGKRAPRWQRE